MSAMVSQPKALLNIINDCFLCGDWKRDPATSGIKQIYGDEALAAAFLWESTDLYLTPAPGSITPGYLILSPKKHYISFAEAPCEIIEGATTVWEYVRGLGTSLNLTSFVLFEHGAASKFSRGAACIEHAHFHLVPSPNPVELRDVMKKDFDESRHTNLFDIKLLGHTSPYILLVTPEGIYSYETPQIESQYLRKYIASQWRMPERWNWKSHPMRENFWKTIDLFKGRFEGVLC